MAKRISALSANRSKGYIAVDDASTGTGKLPVQSIYKLIATEFVPNTTNALAGEVYWYGVDNVKLYKAKTNYSGAWDSSKFDEADVNQVFAKIAMTKNLSDSIATEFVPNSTTTIVGQVYIYNGSLSKAKEVYQGSWDASKFDKVNVADYLHNDFCALSSYTRHFEEISGRYGDESQVFPAMKNSTYQFKLSATDWSVSTLSSSSLKFAIYSVAADGTRTRRVGYFKNDTISSDTFNVVTPSNAVGFVIFFLGDLGESVDVTITNTSYVAEKNVAEKKAVYIGGISGKIFVEESKTSGGKVWLKAVGAQWVVWNGSVSHYYSNSDFATLLGVTQETSEGGESSCLPFSSDKSLVIDSSGNVSIKDRGSVLYTDVVIFTTGFGRLLVANPCLANDLIRAQAALEAKEAVDVSPIQEAMTAAQKTQMYVTAAGGYVYLEEQNVLGGKVFFNVVGGRITTRFNGSQTHIESIGELATRLGVSLETSAKGVVNCIGISGDNCLVLSKNGDLAIKGRNAMVYTDTVLIVCEYGRVTWLNTEVWYDLARAVGKLPGWVVPQSVMTEFTSKLINGDIKDRFAFFTDLHILDGSYGMWWMNLDTTFDKIKAVMETMPVDFLVCGGDLIAGGTTQAKASDMISRYAAKFNAGFKVYLPMEGNHDSNMYGTVSEDDTSNGRFTQNTIDALQFGNVGGKAYYKHEGNGTTFYVLDSSDCENTVTDYMKSQLPWLAAELLAETKEHSAILIHGITNNRIADVGNDFTPFQFASDIISLCAACNGKTTVTLYGNTYDFTSAVTRVEFMLSGHAHADANKTISGIPCIITTNWSVTNMRMDIVMPDYTAGKLHLLRIDNGTTPTSSREIALS